MLRGDKQPYECRVVIAALFTILRRKRISWKGLRQRRESRCEAEAFSRCVAEPLQHSFGLQGEQA